MFANIDNSRIHHFIGIGGVGMSALAWILLKAGYRVSGSDVQESPYLARLQQSGVQITLGHSPENIPEGAVVIRSSAVPKSNVELVTAHKQGLRVLHRAELLARILHTGTGIAVTGTHGKSTTSALVAHLLQSAGCNPTFLLGADAPQLGGNADLGDSSYIVAEADESDGSFLHYYPDYALVTNIEPEHLDFYQNYATELECFAQFINQVKGCGTAFLCVDDSSTCLLLDSLNTPVTTYSIDNQRAEYRAGEISLHTGGSCFRLYRHHQPLGWIRLSVPGIHNVLNATGALALCLRLGLDFASLQAAASTFEGICRRFQVLFSSPELMIIDDYAHHPTEVRATLRAARLLCENNGHRLIAVFQPHRYTRTRSLGKEFAPALMLADEVYLTDIYSAGESPLPGISTRIIYDALLQLNHNHVFFEPERDQLQHRIMKGLRRGDVVLTLGAGDIYHLAHNLTQQISTREM